MGSSNLPKASETTEFLACIALAFSETGHHLVCVVPGPVWYPNSLGQDAELKVGEPCKTIEEADLGLSFADHDCSSDSRTRHQQICRHITFIPYAIQI